MLTNQVCRGPDQQPPQAKGSHKSKKQWRRHECHATYHHQLGLRINLKTLLNYESMNFMSYALIFKKQRTQNGHIRPTHSYSTLTFLTKTSSTPPKPAPKHKSSPQKTHRQRRVTHQHSNCSKLLRNYHLRILHKERPQCANTPLVNISLILTKIENPHTTQTPRPKDG